MQATIYVPTKTIDFLELNLRDRLYVTAIGALQQADKVKVTAPIALYATYFATHGEPFSAAMMSLATVLYGASLVFPDNEKIWKPMQKFGHLAFGFGYGNALLHQLQQDSHLCFIVNTEPSEPVAPGFYVIQEDIFGDLGKYPLGHLNINGTVLGDETSLPFRILGIAQHHDPNIVDIGVFAQNGEFVTLTDLIIDPRYQHVLSTPFGNAHEFYAVAPGCNPADYLQSGAPESILIEPVMQATEPIQQSTTATPAVASLEVLAQTTPEVTNISPTFVPTASPVPSGVETAPSETLRNGRIIAGATAIIIAAWGIYRSVSRRTRND